MGNDALLVIGIHRAELAFGDRVATRLDRDRVDVLRIPHGIGQPKRGPGESFYSRTQHREIYLQLLQQVKGRYTTMIDLHAGLDEAGLSADVYCHDDAFLAKLAARLRSSALAYRVRLVRIVSAEGRDAGAATGSTAESAAESAADSAAEAVADTWIPSKVWLGRGPRRRTRLSAGPASL